MKLRPTSRGFLRGEFVDVYGEECSIQKSSLATEDCIWLGADNQKAKVCVQGEGWKEFPLPKGVEIMPSRMHLSRELVKELLPLLQHFVDTGELPEEEQGK